MTRDARKYLAIALVSFGVPMIGPVLSQVPLPHRGNPACTSVHPCRYR